MLQGTKFLKDSWCSTVARFIYLTFANSNAALQQKDWNVAFGFWQLVLSSEFLPATDCVFLLSIASVMLSVSCYPSCGHVCLLLCTVCTTVCTVLVYTTRSTTCVCVVVSRRRSPCRLLFCLWNCQIRCQKEKRKKGRESNSAFLVPATTSEKKDKTQMGIFLEAELEKKILCMVQNFRYPWYWYWLVDMMLMEHLPTSSPHNTLIR